MVMVVIQMDKFWLKTLSSSEFATGPATLPWGPFNSGEGSLPAFVMWADK